MDDDQQDPESDAGTGEKVARVRIIGAEPAVKRTADDDQLPAGSAVAGEPVDAHGGEVTDLDSFLDAEPAADEPSVGTPLPHWADAPTGEVPAVLSRDAGDAAEGEGDPWSAMPGPTWREEATDWTADEEQYEPSVLAQEDTRLGSLDDSGGDTSERQPWEFELPASGEVPAVRADADEVPDDDTMIVPAVRVPPAGSDPDAAGEPERVVVADLGDDAVVADELPGAVTAAEAAGLAGAATEAAAPVRRMRRGSARAGQSADTEDHDDAADGGRPVPPAPRPVPRSGRPVPLAPPPPRRRPRPRPEGGPPTNGAEHPGAGRNLPVAVATGVVAGVVAVVCFKLGNLPAMVISTVVVTLAAVEAFAAFRRGGYRPVTLLGLAACISLMIATYNKGEVALPLVFILLLAFTLLWHLAGVDRGAEPVLSTAATLLIFGWVGVFASYAALLLNPTLFPDRHGVAFLFGAIVVTVAYDVGALAVGSWIGRHPLAPHASPNKTWEGFFGGAVAAVVVSAVFVHFIHPWTLGSAVVLGLVVSVVAPLGDLSESLIKRDMGLKDMGRFLPGHGGVLDRVDGLLFVLPATYYLVKAFHLG